MKDLVLSSGFLAFARHLGFLQAVEQRGIAISGLCGTSSGALIGAMWSGGMSIAEIKAELTSQKPYSLLAWNWKVWQGLFSMDKLIQRLEQYLPSSFEALPHAFGVGVCTMDRQAQIVCQGSLVHAVAASCAMPYVFAPVMIDGTPFCDGGTVDRIQLTGWRKLRSNREFLVHVVNRSHGAAVEAGLEGTVVVRTPRSGASFFGLGDFAAQQEEARQESHRIFAEKEL